MDRLTTTMSSELGNEIPQTLGGRFDTTAKAIKFTTLFTPILQ